MLYTIFVVAFVLKIPLFGCVDYVKMQISCTQFIDHRFPPDQQHFFIYPRIFPVLLLLLLLRLIHLMVQPSRCCPLYSIFILMILYFVFPGKEVECCWLGSIETERPYISKVISCVVSWYYLENYTNIRFCDPHRKI